MYAAVVDHHVHTRFSDGQGDMAACVERAIEVGLPAIGFADHLVPADYDQPGYGVGSGRLDEYVEAVLSARARYPEVKVLLGIEADYVPEEEEELMRLLEAYPFDYVLGSVHFIGRVGFDETRNCEHSIWDDADAVFRLYYELVGAAAGTGRFAVMSHLDLPKKFGRRPSATVDPFAEAALEAVARAGAAIEINTAGLRSHPVGEMYPAEKLLRRARELGIPVTFGSDAHRPQDVGTYFGCAVRLARRVGYASYLDLSRGSEVALP